MMGLGLGSLSRARKKCVRRAASRPVAIHPSSLCNHQSTALQPPQPIHRTTYQRVLQLCQRCLALFDRSSSFPKFGSLPRSVDAIPERLVQHRHEEESNSSNPNDMPGKTPYTNGNDPVGNRVNGTNGTKDVEMKDDAPASKKGGKGKKGKDGSEEEMTVVVPPSKGSKLGGPPQKDTDGDVAMDGADELDVEHEGAVKVDPVLKAVTGMQAPSSKQELY